MITLLEITESKTDNLNSYGLNVSFDEDKFSFCNLTNDKDEIIKLKSRIENSDIAKEHIKDIIRDFIVGDAYDKIISNEI